MENLTCKLTSEELQHRKASVIESIRKEITGRKELSNGYTFYFKGSDVLIDGLLAFIKSERLCCKFFDFNLFVKGDASRASLEITGPEGAKEFIRTELNL